MLLNKKTAFLLELVTCLFLALSLALAVSAQALPWWDFDSTDETNTFEFGLYRFCMKIDRETTCYRFSRDGMDQLKTDLKLPSSFEAETLDGRTIWILSFLAIIFTGVSFFISVGVVNIGYRGKLMKTVFIVQSCLTLIGGVLGIASVISAYDSRKEVWRSAGVYLYNNGFVAQWVPSTTGVGFSAQAACYIFLWIAFFCNVLLYAMMKNMIQFQVNEVGKKGKAQMSRTSSSL